MNEKLNRTALRVLCRMMSLVSEQATELLYPYFDSLRRKEVYMAIKKAKSLLDDLYDDSGEQNL